MRVTRGMLKASPIKPPLSGLSTTAGTTWNSLPGVASQGRTSTTLCPHQGMRTTISSPATSPGANPSSVEGFCYSRRARKTKAEIHPSDPECERVHGRSLSSLSVQEEGRQHQQYQCSVATTLSCIMIHRPVDPMPLTHVAEPLQRRHKGACVPRQSECRNDILLRFWLGIPGVLVQDARPGISAQTPLFSTHSSLLHHATTPSSSAYLPLVYALTRLPNSLIPNTHPILSYQYVPHRCITQRPH